MDSERAVKQQIFLYAVIIIGILYTFASGYCTYSILAEYDYNQALGKPVLSIFSLRIYSPYLFSEWFNNAKIATVIGSTLNEYRYYPTLSLLASGIMIYILYKMKNTHTSHGTAAFATQKDINESDLGQYESENGGVYKYKHNLKLGKIIDIKFGKIAKKSGVVCGINPYNGKLMLHNGKEHILLMAPTRSGKGVNTIIPTGLVWKNSIFFFDPKGELWENTAGYRKNVLKQKVMKFEPLCVNGSANRWNPLAEVHMETNEEFMDISNIVNIIVRGDKEETGDPFWNNSAVDLLIGVTLHLMYKHKKEKLPLPSISTVRSFLSSPNMDTTALYTSMLKYPHITPDEFLETGNHKNILREVYGEYYAGDLADFNVLLECSDNPIQTVSQLRDVIKTKNFKNIDWSAAPWHRLLTHPRVAECAADMLSNPEQTRGSIIKTARTATAIYGDPALEYNTSVSDFSLRDLLNPDIAVSCYFVMQVKDIQTVKPVSRLFINMLLTNLIRDLKTKEANSTKRQKLLLMLDEFPQLGYIPMVELALAICAGFDIKICIVCQDVNQLNKVYTNNNSIASNCHVHVYFTPNLDGGGATAKAISEHLGNMTITTTNHSDGGGFLKGSDSVSYMSRNLMTPDEVSRMPANKALVVVAGHYTIYADKLRYYQFPFFLDTIRNNPTPTISDTVTVVENFDQLFAIHAADHQAKEEAIQAVNEAKANLRKLAEQEQTVVQKDEAEATETTKEPATNEATDTRNDATENEAARHFEATKQESRRAAFDEMSVANPAYRETLLEENVPQKYCESDESKAEADEKDSAKLIIKSVDDVMDISNVLQNVGLSEGNIEGFDDADEYEEEDEY